MDKISLAGCAIIKDHKILLIRRIETGWYELPGGKIENGETAESTAIRKIKEELCSDIKILAKLEKMILLKMVIPCLTPGFMLVC